MNLIVLGRVKEMKPGTKASVGRKTVTAGKSKSLPRGRATSEESRDTCQVCSVADDSASSVRVECRGGHEFTVHSKCWEAHNMTEQDWADVGLTIGLRKRIRSRLALG